LSINVLRDSFIVNIYRKEAVKNAPSGMVYGGDTFIAQPFTVVYRRELKGFCNNIWIISLTSDQYAGAARFLRLVDYAKKLKNAVRNSGTSCTYIGQRVLTDEEYGSLLHQVAEQERLTQQLITVDADDSGDEDDYDPSGL
jgi:hypothetical protein